MRRTAAFVALWRQVRAAAGAGPSLGTRLRALPRMVVASVRGTPRYDGLWRLLLMGLAALYVLWPLDFLPELLAGPVGLLDDAVVVTWLAGAMLSETGRFLAWEQERLPAVTDAGAVAEPAEDPANKS